MENIKELKITYKDGSELNYNIDGFAWKVQGEDSFSHVLVDSNEIKAKVEKCTVEKADISELKCDKIYAGNFDTNLVKMCNTFNNMDLNKSIYEQVMEYSIDELEEELREIVEETSSEEELCLSCLIRFFLEKSYSEGFKSGLEAIRNRIGDAEEELLFEVAEAGYN